MRASATTWLDATPGCTGGTGAVSSATESMWVVGVGSPGPAVSHPPSAAAADPHRPMETPAASRPRPPAPRPPLDEGRQERKFIGQVRENRLEIPFDWPRGATAGALGRFAGLTPQTELVRDRLLNRLPVREIDRAARAGADEVGFVEGEA